MPPVTVAMPTPATMPSVCDTAIQPPTTPRSRTGTRSGTVALSAANIAFRDACARLHASAIVSTDWADASSTSASAPSRPPATTHGTRRPNRDVVRSDSAPNNGLAITDTADPTPVTTPKTSSLSPGETTSACWASSTWIGPKKPAHRPSPASVTHATQRRGTDSSGSSSADSRASAACTGTGSGGSGHGHHWLIAGSSLVMCWVIDWVIYWAAISRRYQS